MYGRSVSTITLGARPQIMNVMLLNASTYSTPEVRKKGYSVLKSNSLSIRDSDSATPQQTAYNSCRCIWSWLPPHFAINPSTPLHATTQPTHLPRPTHVEDLAEGLFPQHARDVSNESKTSSTTVHFLELRLLHTAGELWLICERLASQSLPVSTTSISRVK